MLPTRMYGTAIKYIMPSLTPSAVNCPSSLSKTALHIAHCAFPLKKKRIKKSKKTSFRFIFKRNKVKSLDKQLRL